MCGYQKLASHWLAACSMTKPSTVMCCSPRVWGANTRLRTVTCGGYIGVVSKLENVEFGFYEMF